MPNILNKWMELLMNKLTESGLISNLDCGTCFSYVLSDNSFFLITEYKVLQSQSDSGFVKCVKMLYNGSIQLYYMPGVQKALGSVLQALSPNKFLKIVLNLLNRVVAVKNNGFLGCQSLDLSGDRIFVDLSTLDVSLVYLPLSRKNYSDYSEFESDLKAKLLECILSNTNLQSEKTFQLCEFLQDESVTVEVLRGIIGGRNEEEEVRPPAENAEATMLTLVATNSPTPFEIKITEPEVLIGKHPKMVNAVISYNKAISRKHCRVFSINGHFYIEDLASSNHTYLNKRRLEPHSPAMLSHGDTIRIADSSFKVEMS